MYYKTVIPFAVSLLKLKSFLSDSRQACIQFRDESKKGIYNTNFHTKALFHTVHSLCAGRKVNLSLEMPAGI